MKTNTCQSCSTAITHDETLYTNDARAVCQACFDKQSVADIAGGRGWMILAHVGAACIVLTFLVSTASTSVTTEGDRVTSFVYRDWIAIGGGASAIGLGLIAFALALRGKSKGAILLYPLAVILAGAFKIATGFGLWNHG